jgi:hypothetical protein
MCGCANRPCDLGELDDKEKRDPGGVYWIQPDSDNALDGLLDLHHRAVHCRIFAVRIASEEVNTAVMSVSSAIRKFRLQPGSGLATKLE